MNVPSKNDFCTYFIHVVPNAHEFRKTVAQKKFYAHTDFKKLEGTFYVVLDLSQQSTNSEVISNKYNK